MIKIIDCGSQLTQNIARRMRELGVFTEIVPFHAKKENILKEGVKGIIISGGQFSVYDPHAPMYDSALLNSGIPVLGICYGQQSIAHLEGGKVEQAKNREYGKTRVRLIAYSPLFKNFPETDFNVWMSHGDIVTFLPQEYAVVGVSENGHIAAMQNTAKNIYTVQFHPEVDHTQDGRKILSNFIEICKEDKCWDIETDYDKLIKDIKVKLQGKIGIGGVSGGVDSKVASLLIASVVGNSYHPIFVDNGLLRLHEAEDVKKSLEPFEISVHYADASQRFLDKLKGVTDPDQKRNIVGHEFIAVFEEEARKIPGASYLVQGTLYPDVIESVPLYGASSKIKRHHNVGGMPEKLGLEIYEPFRTMFKDEVRRIAEKKLGLSKEIVWRHPFPGPGLAVRIKGEVTLEKLRILRQADFIFIQELKRLGIYEEISQAFAVLTNDKSVGVMGDEGNYEAVIGLRAITTNDFMTSDVYHFKWEDLQMIANRIINEVRGVNRVVCDVSQKPPATIEWE